MSWLINSPQMAAKAVKCSCGSLWVHMMSLEMLRASGSLFPVMGLVSRGSPTPSSYCGGIILRYAAPVTPHIGFLTLLHSPLGVRYFWGKQKAASTSGQISDSIVSWMGTPSTREVSSVRLREKLEKREVFNNSIDYFLALGCKEQKTPQESLYLSMTLKSAVTTYHTNGSYLMRCKSSACEWN